MATALPLCSSTHTHTLTHTHQQQQHTAEEYSSSQHTQGEGTHVYTFIYSALVKGCAADEKEELRISSNLSMAALINFHPSSNEMVCCCMPAHTHTYTHS